MASGITLDMREFDKAMVQYAAASGKDFKDIVNRQMLNLSIQGVKLQQRAERDKIKQVENLPWWPKYVAKVLAKQGRYTRAQARKASKTLVRKRLKAIGFLRFFFIRMSQAVAPLTGKPGRKGKSFQGFEVSVKPATRHRPTTGVSVGYTYRKRSDKTARKADALLQKILPRAIAATVIDMRKYVDKKMGKTAKKYSARGA